MIHSQIDSFITCSCAEAKKNEIDNQSIDFFHCYLINETLSTCRSHRPDKLAYKTANLRYIKRSIYTHKLFAPEVINTLFEIGKKGSRNLGKYFLASIYGYSLLVIMQNRAFVSMTAIDG
jgi:hypothetical protein